MHPTQGVTPPPAAQDAELTGVFGRLEAGVWTVAVTAHPSLAGIATGSTFDGTLDQAVHNLRAPARRGMVAA